MTPPLVPGATISRATPAFSGLDYAALRREGLDYIQRCASETWTDFNAHDPGVTLLELLAFALTDLSYRAGFDMTDLLADEQGRIDRAGLPPAWRALPSPPVTIADFRRMLLDRVGGLGNVWIEPRAAAGGVDGLYDVYVQPLVPLPGETGDEAPDERLGGRVIRAFARQRPLGEDIGEVVVLRSLPVVLEVRIHVARGTDAEAIMAQAIQRAALALAPEPRRTDLATMMTERSDTLFDGPLPAGGFIRDAELGPKPTTIALDLLVARIEEIPGVLAVHDAALHADGKPIVDGILAIPTDRFACLDAKLGDRDLPLKIVVDHRARPIDHRRARQLLHDAWRQHRQLYPVKHDLARALPMPTGIARDLSGFAPIAASLPHVYGLGDGIEPPETAPARQLLGFLAIFETLMIDFVDRLAQVPGWLADGTWSGAPLASAKLLERVPALRQLEASIAPDPDHHQTPPGLPLEQQERLADFLLALHGQDAGDVPVPPTLPPVSTGAIRHRLEIKRALLARASALARRKGRGFDYRARPAPGKLSGIELRTRLLLGDRDVADRRHRVRIGIVEHVLLRPRTAERAAFEGDVHDYGLTVSAVIHLPHGKDGHSAYRHAVEAALRDALPAHLTLDIHLVERNQWRRFAAAYRHWRAGLRRDDDETIDWTSVELREMLAAFAVGVTV